jgi:hypothetical protein
MSSLSAADLYCVLLGIDSGNRFERRNEAWIERMGLVEPIVPGRRRRRLTPAGKAALSICENRARRSTVTAMAIVEDPCVQELRQACAIGST